MITYLGSSRLQIYTDCYNYLKELAIPLPVKTNATMDVSLSLEKSDYYVAKNTGKMFFYEHVKKLKNKYNINDYATYSVKEALVVDKVK